MGKCNGKVLPEIHTDGLHDGEEIQDESQEGEKEQ
jgi:hypothetical protein